MSDPRSVRECNLSAVSTIGWMEDAEEIGKVLEVVARLEEAKEVEDIEVLSKSGEPGLLKIRGYLKADEKIKMVACLPENADIFAWSAAEMLGIDVEVAFHRLNLDPAIKSKRLGGAGECV